MYSLLMFPDEVNVRILSISNLKEIVNCSLTCRRLYQTVRNSLALQYRIAQLAAKVTDIGSSSLTTRERFDLLERNSGIRWELVHGVLAFQFGGTPSQARGLDFTELPSNIRGTPGRTWCHEDVGISIRDFTVDPFQDLLVIIERPVISGSSDLGRVKYPIHLWTMSTGLPHPQAGFSEIPTNITLRHEQYSFSLQATNDILIVLCLNRRPRRPYPGQDHLYIWNWKRGQLLLHKTTPEKTIRFDSFSILPSGHLLLSSFDPVLGSRYTPRLDIYKTSPLQDEETIDAVPAYTFKLPTVSEEARVVSMLVRSDPPGTNRVGRNRVFAVAPSSCVIVVELGVRGVNKPCRLMLFVHASTLLSIASSGSLNSTIPWENWGPVHSRFIESEGEASWVGYVYGMRYIELFPMTPRTHRGGRLSCLHIKDFNPTPLPSTSKLIHCDDAAPFLTTYKFPDKSSDTSTIRWITEASLIPKARGVFTDHVRTCLHYRDITSSRMYRYDGVVIDEDALIGFYPKKESGKMMQGIEVLCV